MTNNVTISQNKASALQLARAAGQNTSVAALLAYGVDAGAKEIEIQGRLVAARAALTRAAKQPVSQLAR